MAYNIITTVQACGERLEYITPLVKAFNPIIHVDKKRKGSLVSFIDMLEIPVIDYRFHLQDDVIIADELEKYLPELVKFMNVFDFHMITLYSPPRPSLLNAHKNGKRLYESHNFLGVLGCLFSKKFVEELKLHVPNTKQIFHDDFFIQEVLDKTGIKSYVHLPILVQHNITMHSINGNKTIGDHTVSDIFDKDFITKKYAKV